MYKRICHVLHDVYFIARMSKVILKHKISGFCGALKPRNPDILFIKRRSDNNDF